MISILTPTRGRFAFVERMLNSIITNASSKDNYEIIFGIDNDDQDTAVSIEVYLTDKDINYKIVRTERFFYKGFHLYLNELYKHSRGDLLWTYPDDVIIETPNWDAILNEYKDEMYVMVNLGITFANWPFSLIPVISRKWIEITGRFAENSQTDCWLGEIARDLNIIKKVDNVICSLYYPSDGSQHNMSDYFSYEKQKIRLEDQEKIRAFLNKYQ